MAKKKPSKKSKGEKPELTIERVIKKRRADAGLKLAYRNLFERIAMLVIVGLILFTQIFMITPVNGMEMFPNLKDGDLAIVYRLQSNYIKDDVVVYELDGQKRIGRVVGKEADLIDIDVAGNLYINGSYQSSEEILYPTFKKDGVTYPLQILEDELFVLGDYRTSAVDSRDYGAISTDDVKGKVITVIRRRGL